MVSFEVRMDQIHKLPDGWSIGSEATPYNRVGRAISPNIVYRAVKGDSRWATHCLRETWVLFPSILRSWVFLNLFQVRSIVSSQCKKSVLLLPQSHCERDFGSEDVLKMCDLSIGQHSSEDRKELLVIKRSSSNIEAVLHMIETHSSGKDEL